MAHPIEAVLAAIEGDWIPADGAALISFADNLPLLFQALETELRKVAEWAAEHSAVPEDMARYLEDAAGQAAELSQSADEAQIAFSDMRSFWEGS